MFLKLKMVNKMNSTWGKSDGFNHLTKEWNIGHALIHKLRGIDEHETLVPTPDKCSRILYLLTDGPTCMECEALNSGLVMYKDLYSSHEDIMLLQNTVTENTCIPVIHAHEIHCGHFLE